MDGSKSIITSTWLKSFTSFTLCAWSDFRNIGTTIGNKRTSIFSIHGKIDGIKVAICGDLAYGRTTHSLVKLLALYDNVTIYGVSSKFFTLPQEYIDYIKERNVKYIPCSEFKDLPQNIDVIYHTRTQLERIEDKSIEIKELIINKKLLNQFSKGTLLLHPLPRVKEIAEDVDNDPRAIYFEQAHNGMYVRMAILVSLLGNHRKLLK